MEGSGPPTRPPRLHDPDGAGAVPAGWRSMGRPADVSARRPSGRDREVRTPQDQDLERRTLLFVFLVVVVELVVRVVKFVGVLHAARDAAHVFVGSPAHAV